MTNKLKISKIKQFEKLFKNEIIALGVSLILFEIILGFMHYLFRSQNDFHILNRLFDVNSEANVPTWFSTVQLFCVSLISLKIILLEIKQIQKVSTIWITLSLIFLFLSVDESAQIHEIIDQKDIFEFKWVYYYVPAVIVVSVFALYSLKVKFQKNVIVFYMFILGGALFCFGGLFLEVIGDDIRCLNFMENQLHLKYAVIELTEEMTEMFGVSLILVSLAIYYKNIKNTYSDTRIDGNYP